MTDKARQLLKNWLLNTTRAVEMSLILVSILVILNQ